HGSIRILGTEYCGKPENHDYRLYLALKGVLPRGISAQDLPVH
ncbi:hypothetical protein C8R28_102643, partial [Nitrosomonas ureae]